MKPWNHSFQNCKLSQNRFEKLSKIRDPNINQIEHVYAICCRLEVANSVFSGKNVMAVEGYGILNV